MFVCLAATAVAAPTLADTVALHRRSDGVVRDPQQLQVDYDLLCAAGESLACRWRAWDSFGRAKDVDLAGGEPGEAQSTGREHLALQPRYLLEQST